MKDEYGFSKTLNQVATWMIVSLPSGAELDIG